MLLGLPAILAVAALVLFRQNLGGRPRPLLPGEEATPGINVLLVSWDTTRPDPLRACGGSRVPTPGLDRILGGGFLLQQMIAPAPITLPSHASLFTGQNPYRHGVRENTEHALPPGRRTLAGVFRDAGYLTQAFIASFILDARFGLAQGFEGYEDGLNGPEPGLGPTSVEVPGAIEAARACRWIGDYGARRRRGEEGRPFFLFLHFYDAHAPYRPPPPFSEIYGERPYDGELAYQDQCLGQVLDALEASGEAARTLVWVVSDHGESLGEHGESGHSLFIYDTTLRVVSLLRLPPAGGRFRAGRPRMIVHAQTGLIDVAPTLCALSGIRDDLPEEDGRSLVPLLRGKKAEDRLLYCETMSPQISFHWAPLQGVRTPRLKYIRAPEPELYNLRDDPAEERNLIPSEGAEARALQDALDRFLMGSRETARRIPDREEMERLRSLGYLAGSAESRAAAGEDTVLSLPDPKKMVAFFNSEYQQAKTLLYQGRFREAADAFENARRIDPLNNSIHLFLAGALRQLSRYAEAGASYRRALLIEPRSPRAYFGWGEALLAEGKADSAAWAFRESVALLPASPDSWLRLGSALWIAGRKGEAAEAMERSLSLGADPRALHGLLARLYREAADQARMREHLAAYARALGVDEDEALRRLPPAPVAERERVAPGHDGGDGPPE